MVVGEIVNQTELLVIGAGPGGYVAALRAAQVGLDVTLVEAEELGGICLQQGCIPSKAWIAAADDYERAKGLGNLGLPLQPGPVDLAQLRAFKDRVVSQLTNGVAQLLSGRDVHVVKGRAAFISPKVATVEGPEGRQLYRFGQAILATGSHARRLSALPADGERILLPRHLLAMETLPKTLTVVGGGYIGIELGTAAAKLGSQVTILEYADRLLGQVDPDLVRVVERRLKELGVAVRKGVEVQTGEARQDGVAIRFAPSGGGASEEIVSERVLVSVGRDANLADLGLAEAGIPTDGPFLHVDERMRTNIPHIFAVGDVTGNPMLAHRASHQGYVAAEVAAGKTAAFLAQAIPAVVFSDPELATVGLSEEEATMQGYSVRTAQFPMRALGRALAGRTSQGVAKLVAEQESGVLLGAGICAAHASELIAEMTLAIEMGATLEDLAATIHSHPTYAEAWHEAALLGLGNPLHVLK
ncbi:MAG: dihydrolipoyl dehydrogenase [Thermaerobacter sp.]|nr:dihydrolipoyl dehydrogenase [Thermaerobacter sp.]